MDIWVFSSLGPLTIMLSWVMFIKMVEFPSILPMSKIEIWESSREVPTDHCCKNIQDLNILKRERGIISLYIYHSSSKVAQLSANRDLLSHDFFQGEKWEHESECLISSAVQDSAKEAHFFFAPYRILRWATWLRCREGLGNSSWGLEHNKVIW